MHQNIIYTLTAGLSIALVLGFITQRLKLSPIIGYLIAGMCVGPFSPGFVADSSAANQFAEIGIILLMFGIGLHFHIKDLLAVKNIAIPGAVTQILITTLFSMFLAHLFGWGWGAGVVFGIAISVASTVVLTRVSQKTTICTLQQAIWQLDGLLLRICSQFLCWCFCRRFSRLITQK